MTIIGDIGIKDTSIRETDVEDTSIGDTDAGNMSSIKTFFLFPIPVMSPITDIWAVIGDTFIGVKCVSNNGRPPPPPAGIGVCLLPADWYRRPHYIYIYNLCKFVTFTQSLE